MSQNHEAQPSGSGSQGITRRRLLGMVGVSAAAIVLAACQPSAPAPAPTTAPAANQSGSTGSSGSATPTAVAQAQPGAAQKVTLVLWSPFGDPDENINTQKQKDPNKINPEDIFDKWVLDNYKAKHPNIDIKPENHGWDEPLRQAMLTAILGGTGPDIAVGEGYVAQFAAQGSFAAIENKEILTQIIPGTVANATIQGKTYGICHRTSTFTLQYNKDVLKKSGIDPSPSAQPKSWDDLLANIAKVTEAGKGEFYGYAVQGEGSFGLGPAYRITPWLRQLGTEIATLDGATLKFNDPKGFPAWEFVRQQFKFSPPGLAFVGDEGKIVSQLYQGKVGYQPAHSFYIADAINAGADAGYVPLPLPKGGKRGNALVANFIYSPLSGSKNKDAAIDFCVYLGDKDVQLKGSEVGRIPSNKLALQDPNVFKGYPNAEPLKVFIDALLNDDEAPLPSFPKNPQKIWTTWNTSMTRVVQTNDPIKQIWDAAQQEAEGYQK